MSEQKGQEGRLHGWFCHENGNTSSISDTSDRASTSRTEKYRKVTSSSSFSSSTKSTDAEEPSSSLLHVHRIRKRKNNDLSSSSEEKNDAASSSSDTSEKDDSSSSSLNNMFKPGRSEVESYSSERKRVSDTSFSNSSESSETGRQTTSLHRPLHQVPNHERDQNGSESSSSSQDVRTSRLPSSSSRGNEGKGDSKSRTSNSSSSDTKEESYASSTSSPPSESSDQNDPRLMDIVSDALEAYVSSYNSAPSDESVEDNTKPTRESADDAVGAYVSSSSSEKQPPTETKTCAAPVSMSTFSSSFKREVPTSDYLTSAIDSIVYRDYSHIKPDDTGLEMVKSNVSSRLMLKKEPPFPQKLHQILADPDSKESIIWLPHGRAWKILDQGGLEKKVIPRFFRHCKLASFMRKVNVWGFKRVPSGPDENSYYHELFLRGLPHICTKMTRQPNGRLEERSKSIYSRIRVAPDFYQLSKEHPLPDENGVFPTLRKATASKDSSSIETMSSSVGQSNQALARSTTDSSSSLSMNTGVLPYHQNLTSYSNILAGGPLHTIQPNTVHTTPYILQQAPASQGSIPQQHSPSVAVNSPSLILNNIPGVGSIPRIVDVRSTMVGAALFGSAANQQLCPRSVFGPTQNSSVRTVNNTGQPATGSNIGQQLNVHLPNLVQK